MEADILVVVVKLLNVKSVADVPTVDALMVADVAKAAPVGE